jgi:hypothetical protein
MFQFVERPLMPTPFEALRIVPTNELGELGGLPDWSPFPLTSRPALPAASTAMAAVRTQPPRLFALPPTSQPVLPAAFAAVTATQAELPSRCASTPISQPEFPLPPTSQPALPAAFTAVTAPQTGLPSGYASHPAVQPTVPATFTAMAAPRAQSPNRFAPPPSMQPTLPDAFALVEEWQRARSPQLRRISTIPVVRNPMQAHLAYMPAEPPVPHEPLAYLTSEELVEQGGAPWWPAEYDHDSE